MARKANKDKEAVLKRHRAGMDRTEIYVRFPKIAKSTIRRWCMEEERGTFEVKESETKRVKRHAEAAMPEEVKALNVVDDPELVKEIIEPAMVETVLEDTGDTRLKARHLAEKMGAGLEYQVKTAVWMSSNRYKLAISTMSPTGGEKIIQVPILPHNIDWERQIVKFDGKEYNLDCLIPDNAAAKLGLEMLIKLTGTDTETTEEVKSRAKLKAIEAERAQENDLSDSRIAISLSRPRRKTLEEVVEERNEQVESAEDAG